MWPCTDPFWAAETLGLSQAPADAGRGCCFSHGSPAVGKVELRKFFYAFCREGGWPGPPSPNTVFGGGKHPLPELAAGVQAGRVRGGRGDLGVTRCAWLNISGGLFAKTKVWGKGPG